MCKSKQKKSTEPISEKSKFQIYENDLKILLDIKKSIGLLNNAIHDKAALIAISVLERKYPRLKFYYSGAGIGGMDLVGKTGNKIKLVAEIKTTTIETGNTLKGPQIANIKKDLEKLITKNINYKYLILISQKVEKNLRKRLDFKNKYSNIKILTVFEGNN